MARARHHYMADWYFPDPGAADGFHRESERIVAYDDAEAIREAAPLKSGVAYWRVRKVTRAGSEVIHDSRREVSHA